MKRTELDKLRSKSAEDLTGMIGDLRESMLKSRISRSLEGKQVGMQYRDARRQIARIHTILSQKVVEQASGKKA